MYTGTMQGSAQEGDHTPAYAQSAVQTPPAAPQRQSKAAVSATAHTGLQKLQLHKPAPEIKEATGTAAAGSGDGESARTAEQTGKAGQKDLKTLIHQEFARLMATKTLTPNEAAVLAVKNVTQQ